MKESIMAITARKDLKLLLRIRAQVKKKEISPTYKFIKKTWCSLHNAKTLGFLIAILCWFWKYLNLKCPESSKLNKTGVFFQKLNKNCLINFFKRKRFFIFPRMLVKQLYYAVLYNVLLFCSKVQLLKTYLRKHWLVSDKM